MKEICDVIKTEDFFQSRSLDVYEIGPEFYIIFPRNNKNF